MSTRLQDTSHFGCVEIKVALLEADGWDVQATDFHGNTSIAWAAWRGHGGHGDAVLAEQHS